MTEAELHSLVVEALKVGGWRYHHCTSYGRRGGLRGHRGFPDVVAVHPTGRQTVWLELKSERGRLSEGQEEWRDVLQAAGAAWLLVRPSGDSEGRTLDELLAYLAGGGR